MLKLAVLWELRSLGHALPTRVGVRIVHTKRKHNGNQIITKTTKMTSWLRNAVECAGAGEI